MAVTNINKETENRITLRNVPSSVKEYAFTTAKKEKKTINDFVKSLILNHKKLNTA